MHANTPVASARRGDITPVARFSAVAARTPPLYQANLGSGWTAEVYDRHSAIDPSLWRILFSGGWKDRRYYQTLEETFAGKFDQHYLLLRDARGQARALQPFFLVKQDLTVSLPSWLRALSKPLRPLLCQDLLMAGCVVGEGRIGVRALQEVPALCAPLDEALSLFARRRQVRLILFKDYPAAYRPLLAGLTERGPYIRLPSLPAVHLALRDDSFEAFVKNRLGKATRKSLRRKLREVDALPDPILLEVKNRLTPSEAIVVHALYERVAHQGEAHFEVFDSDYFFRLGERMPDHTRFFIWRYQGEVVAFSFCTVDGESIHDNDLGLHGTLASPLHLYHVTFRDIMRWALAQGIKHYYSSPFNYDPKLHLRMDLVPLDLYARHCSPFANRLLRWFAPFAAPTRRQPILQRFRNAEQL